MGEGLVPSTGRMGRWAACAGLAAALVAAAWLVHASGAPPPVPRGKVRVYCAGPMGGHRDFEEMRALAAGLRAAGYQTYLPVDEGFSLILIYEALAKSGRPAQAQDEARYWLMVAVYGLDMFRLLKDCNAVVANTNPFEGPVNPDAGTVMEVSVAAAYGMPRAFYKSDAKRLLPPGTVKGTGWDNPMIVGLAEDFSLLPGYAAGSLEELVRSLDRECAEAGPLVEREGILQFSRAAPLSSMPKDIRNAVALGEKVAEMKKKYIGKVFTDALFLEQSDEITALLRAEGPKHGFPPFKAARAETPPAPAGEGREKVEQSGSQEVRK